MAASACHAAVQRSCSEVISDERRNEGSGGVACMACQRKAAPVVHATYRILEQLRDVVSSVGIEPTTHALKVRCSTD